MERKGGGGGGGPTIHGIEGSPRKRERERSEGKVAKNLEHYAGPQATVGDRCRGAAASGEPGGGAEQAAQVIAGHLAWQVGRGTRGRDCFGP